MSAQNQLERLAATVRERFGPAVSVAISSESLFVEFDHWEDGTTVIGVSERDELRFSVAYPELSSSWSPRARPEIRDAFAENVMEAGVLWILKKVARFGHVPPEV